MAPSTKTQAAHNRAALLLRILGDKLPDSVFSALSEGEQDKLISLVSQTKDPSWPQEKKLLQSFLSSVPSFQRQAEEDPITLEMIAELEALLHEEQPTSLLPGLSQMSKPELSQMILGEKPAMIALVLCFANSDLAAELLEEYPESLKTQILLEIEKLDLHSEKERDRLERFLRFKQELLQNQLSSFKIKDQRGKKAAELLLRLNPGISRKIMGKIQQTSPSFAENINDHLYTMEDLMHLGRSSLNRFLSEFHPIIVATAFKGIEEILKEELLARLDHKLRSSIRLEEDSLGPVSLAEIELCQTGILEELHKSIENGTMNLWRE